MKTLILYSYHEEGDSIVNLSFFLKHGLIHNPEYMYIFLINNTNHLVKIKETNNIKVIEIIDGYDHFLLSYKWYLTTIKETNPNYLEQFDRFYFINSNCIGPFLPTIVDTNWIELFNKKLVSCDLIAPIVEFPPDSKGYSLFGIQTELNVPFLHLYMFGTNQSSIDLLINSLKDVNSNDNHTIINAERKITGFFLLNNKKIQCLLLAFNNYNINDKSIWKYQLWNNNRVTCYEHSQNYFGLDVNPLEIIFIHNIVNKNLNHQSNISIYLYKMLKNYITWY